MALSSNVSTPFVESFQTSQEKFFSAAGDEVDAASRDEAAVHFFEAIGETEYSPPTTKSHHRDVLPPLAPVAEEQVAADMGLPPKPRPSASLPDITAAKKRRRAVNQELKLKQAAARQHLHEDNQRHWLQTRGKSEMIDFSDEERYFLRSYFDHLGPVDGKVSIESLEEAFIALAIADTPDQVLQIFGRQTVVDFPRFLKSLRDANHVVLQVFQALMRGDLLGKTGKQLSFSTINSTCRRKFLLDGLMGTGVNRQRGQRILRAYEEQYFRKKEAEKRLLPSISAPNLR
jgi:hypothetical protein